MDLDYTDRIYKTIDAKIGSNEFMRILSKIDKDQKVTVEFYHYQEEDIDKKDGTIKNKRNRYITKEPIDIYKFDDMINRLPLAYPEFEILGITDFSNLTLDEAIEKIKDKEYGRIIK